MAPIRSALRLIPLLIVGCGLLPTSDAKLAKMLQDKSPAVCQRAILIIAEDKRVEVSHCKSADLLGALLNDSRTIVRCTAAYALGQLADPASVHPLVKALDDPKAMVRCDAASALGHMRAAKAAANLASVARYDIDPYVRAAAAKALGRIASPEAIQALISILQDRNTSVAHAAARALHAATGHPFDMRYTYWKQYWKQHQLAQAKANAAQPKEPRR